MNILGCAVPKSMMPPGANNQKGYFESTAIRDFNDHILYNLETRWHDWKPAFDDSWLNGDEAAVFVRKGVDLLRHEFGAEPLFVLKDPRICKMIPFWQKVLQASDVEPFFLHTHRNPVEVSQSLEKRNQFDREYVNLLWLRHVLDAEYASRSHNRAFLNYAQSLDFGPAELRALKKIPGLPKSLSADLRDRIARFSDADLRHHTETLQSVQQDPRMPDWVSATYQIMEDWAGGPGRKADFAQLDDIRADLNRTSRALGTLIWSPLGQAGANRLRSHVTKLEQTLSDTQQEKDTGISELQGALEQANARVKTETEETAQARTDLARLKQTLSDTQQEKDTRISELQGALEQANARVKTETEETAQARTDLARLQQTLSDTRREKDTKISELQSTLEQANARVKIQNEEAIRARTDLARLKQTLSDTQQEKDAGFSELQGALEQANARVKTEAEETAQARTDLARLEQTLNDTRREKDTRISELSDQLAQTQSRLQQRKAEVDDAQDQITAALRTQEELLAENAAHRSERQKLDVKITALEGSLNRRFQEIGILTRELTRQNEETAARLTATAAELKSLDDRYRAAQALNDTLKGELETARQRAQAEISGLTGRLKDAQGTLKDTQSARDKTAVELQSTRERAQAEISGLTGRLKDAQSARDKTAAELETARQRARTEISDLTGKLKDARGRLKHTQSTLDKTAAELEGARDYVARQAKQTEALTQQVAEQHAATQSALVAYEQIQQSKFWRLTAPIRHAVDILRRASRS